MRADDPLEAAVLLAADRQAAREHGHIVPVLVPKPELSLVCSVASMDGVVQVVGARAVFGMQERLPRAHV